MSVPTSTLVNTHAPKQNNSKRPTSRFVFNWAEELPGYWSPFYNFHIFLTNVEPCSSSDWPSSGLLCLFGTVGWSGCCKVMIVKCDFLKTSMFVNNVTQHPLTWVYGLDHFPQANPRKPTSMLVKPVSGINFHVSFRESTAYIKVALSHAKKEVCTNMESRVICTKVIF